MKKKWLGIIIGTIVMAAALTGCGSSKESAAYVQGVLDVAYNKGTEGYVKAAGVKVADAKKYTEQSLEAEAKVMAAYFGIEEPSDEVIKTFEECCKELYKNISYDVEAKGDKVQISAKNIKLGGSEAVQQYVDDFNVKEFVDGDESCTEEAFAKGITEILLKESEGYFCGTKTLTIEVTVTEKDGKYSISDEDLEKIDEQLIVYQ